jgi:hypothetical protein
VNNANGVTLSHPTPLRPDADLAHVLEDMRRCVAARGDEGLLMRVLTMRIRLALLSILDTLIGLLADFRAGRLSPVLPALDEPEHQPHAPPPHAQSDPAALFRENPAARRTRVPNVRFVEDPSDTPAAAPEQNAAEPAAGTPRRPRLTRVSSCPREKGPEPGPRGIALHPSVVPRSANAAFGGRAPLPTHGQFVTI